MILMLSRATLVYCLWVQLAHRARTPLREHVCHVSRDGIAKVLILPRNHVQVVRACWREVAGRHTDVVVAVVVVVVVAAHTAHAHIAHAHTAHAYAAVAYCPSGSAVPHDSSPGHYAVVGASGLYTHEAPCRIGYQCFGGQEVRANQLRLLSCLLCDRTVALVHSLRSLTVTRVIVDWPSVCALPARQQWRVPNRLVHRAQPVSTAPGTPL